jgi:hypothetical protein
MSASAAVLGNEPSKPVAVKPTVSWSIAYPAWAKTKKSLAIFVRSSVNMGYICQSVGFVIVSSIIHLYKFYVLSRVFGFGTDGFVRDMLQLVLGVLRCTYSLLRWT